MGATDRRAAFIAVLFNAQTPFSSTPWLEKMFETLQAGQAVLGSRIQ